MEYLITGLLSIPANLSNDELAKIEARIFVVIQKELESNWRLQTADLNYWTLQRLAPPHLGRPR